MNEATTDNVLSSRNYLSMEEVCQRRFQLSTGSRVLKIYVITGYYPQASEVRPCEFENVLG